MPTEPKTNYLAKLLTLLVKRSDGVIRIPIQDLMVDDIGQGFQVYFDQLSKELVLTFVPAGSTTYKIEGAVSWLTNQPLPRLVSSNEPKPHSQEDLVAKAWTESAATPTLAEVAAAAARPPRPKVIHLTTEGMADAEVEKAKRAAMKEIEEYQSPQPAVTPLSRSRVIFSKP